MSSYTPKSSEIVPAICTVQTVPGTIFLFLQMELPIISTLKNKPFIF